MASVEMSVGCLVLSILICVYWMLSKTGKDLLLRVLKIRFMSCGSTMTLSEVSAFGCGFVDGLKV